MTSPDVQVLGALRRKARSFATRAHAPYSGQRDAAALLMADGTVVPGVRVESVAFSLTIPPLLNAVTTAWARGTRPVLAAVLSRPVRPEEETYLRGLPHDAFSRIGDDVCLLVPPEDVPRPGVLLDPFLPEPLPPGPSAGVALARVLAEQAYVPASQFPVGCVLEAEGGLLPGTNVEHPDWSQILCAERSALGTAITYGQRRPKALYLSCLKDPAGSPCGACRQLLVELAPEVVLWMDRGASAPADAQPRALLPDSFRGQTLRPDA